MVGGRSKQISTSHLRLQDPKAVPVELSWEMVEQVMPAPMTSMTPTSDGPTPDPLIQPPPVDHRSRPASPAPEPFRRALSVMAPAKSPGRPAARLRDCLPPEQPRQTHRLGAPQIQERIRSRNATLDYYERKEGIICNPYPTTGDRESKAVDTQRSPDGDQEMSEAQKSFPTVPGWGWKRAPSLYAGHARRAEAYPQDANPY
uniref:Uncharacterized protein n=1 Tax=Timema cristinae TaxID=61476 RepID=A0A7R9DGU3_TIMCR|nr:unnamed protein product [Timema cristinae]